MIQPTGGTKIGGSAVGEHIAAAAHSAPGGGKSARWRAGGCRSSLRGRLASASLLCQGDCRRTCCATRSAGSSTTESLLRGCAEIYPRSCEQPLSPIAASIKTLYVLSFLATKAVDASKCWMNVGRIVD